MRKFRFIGDPEDYNNDVIFGEIYLENYQPNKWPLSVIGYFGLPEWEEVIEKPKPLHKDTDLGYFAGLIFQGMMINSNWGGTFISMSIDAVNAAKQLIKQLDQQAK
jgi:hypothetical protein